MGAARGRPGGRLLPGYGASGVGNSPTPDHSSFSACGRGPIPPGCGCGGCRRGDPSPTPQRALLRAGSPPCRGGMRVPEGGASCPGVGRPGSGTLPTPTTRPFGRAAGAHYPLAVGAGGAAWGPVTNPTARALASRLCALWGRHEGAQGGRLFPGCGASGVGCSPIPDRSSFRACGRGSLPTGCGCAGCRRGDPSPTPQRALLRAGFARCGGGMRVPGGGASCLGVGRPGTGALPAPTARPFGRAAGARFLLAVGVVCGCGCPAVLGTFSRAAVRRVLCALPGFAAPGGRCGLAPASCPGCGWRRASLACLVAPRWCAAPRPVRSLSVLRSAFPSPWCLPPPRGLSPPALLGGCAGQLGAGREPGSLCLPLAPAEQRALGALCVVPVRRPAMRLSLAGPSGFGLGLRALRWFGVCGPGH